jgi:predicted permease
MSWLRFISRGHRDTDLAKEIEHHLAREIDDNLASGMNKDEARRQAYLKFGSPRKTREDLWQQNTIASLDNLWRDLKYSLRALRHTPGFTVMAVLVMALGIGANTALFTIVRSVLLKPLPYSDPDRLVMLYEKGNDPKSPDNAVSAAGFIQWQKTSKMFESMALLHPWASYNVAGDGGQLPEKVAAALCSWNLFSTLGVQPAIGRIFNPDDDRQDANATVVLSWGFWKRRFGGDPAIVGKDILLNAKPYTVLGVMPAWFAFPEAGTQLWTPANHEKPPKVLLNLENHQFYVVARLGPGATLAQAVNEVDTVQKQIHRANPLPAVNDGVTGRLMLDDVVKDYKTPLYALLAATGCVLLIACLNVANLLVARSAARRREVAIRAALGGSRSRLIREQLTESIVLSFAGGMAGLALAYAGLAWLRNARHDLVRVDTIHIDATTVVFVAVVTIICGVLAGLIPALSIAGNRVMEALRESARSHGGGITRARLRKALLAAEVSLTVVLLIAAGLLLKSYQKLRSTDMGCAMDNVLIMELGLPEARYKTPVQKAQFFEQLISRVRAIPGLQAAGLVTAAPGQGWWGDNIVQVVEHPPLPRGQYLDAAERAADPGYFAALQIPVLRGRTFTDNERLDNANVVIINQTAARQFFPSEDPLGKHLRLDSPDAPHNSFEVIGVVGDTRYYVSEDVKPMMYWPLSSGQFSYATIMVRSTHDVESLALPVQRVIAAMDRDLPVSHVMTMMQLIGKSTVDASFDSMLVLAFAIIALLLAAVGLYGVLSYLVTQRTSEIGVRIALGAQRNEVLRLMLFDGLAPAWAGLALGLVGAAFAVRLIRDMLYGVQPLDWSVFAAVALMLIIVAALACAIPAWRASRLDPMEALRTE